MDGRIVMGQADDYLGMLRGCLKDWEQVPEVVRNAVFQKVLVEFLGPESTHRGMYLALGVATLDALSRGEITIGKLERDKANV